MAMATVFGRRHSAGFFHLSLRDDWRPNFKILKEITGVGGGAVLEQLVLRIGFFSYAAIVANLGTAVFAAHQICAQFQNLSFTFGDGIGVAGTSLVGQSLGRKRPDMAKLYGIASQRMAMTVALVLATSIVIFRHQLVGIFSDDPYITGLASSVMLLLAIFQPFQTSSVVVSGALRGAGDTMYVAGVMMLCVGLMRPLLALLAVFLLKNVFGLPEIALMGAWAAAIIDMATRVTLVYRRFSGGKWCNIKV
jgi:putative MATE family efflux protein